MVAVMLVSVIFPFYLAAQLCIAAVRAFREGMTPQGRERAAQRLIDYYERHPRAYNRKWKRVDAIILKLLS